MLQLLICDDDPLFSQALDRYIRASLAAQQLAAQSTLCASGASFLDALKEQRPDLVFLDLSLEDAEGFQLAQQVRKAYIDTEIVFITSYPERMPEAFAYRPIGFLPKPVDQAQIDTLISRFLLYQQDKAPRLHISTRDTIVPLAPRDILYIESSGHHVLLYTRGGAQPLRQKARLDDLADQLPAGAFIRVHKSFLVHISAIDSIDKVNMHALLSNGARLPISRSYYAQAIQQFIQYQLC